ncbi:UDP-3-O-(3-hydroxymyristoyl)glucosamine N-acyltransferase [Candidatus Nitrosacidococcus sp. I8]|uniref:UDP-3-O-(3-hydroxymyristoyl)glucosamine N-acyltransferase n=1 Tax=Candidatus Nitrosacidococcus sp. I8 TaxID=2942908 RepID=UPI002227BB1C|nr:UDP-3-O-(3-hydroxymyristoyl)glucosamine N-acyltransferase [Candidatus Nitrosacidococcus sp. I8]CAH9015284.1 UDP-3-O-acylglucosamine N-acyltransferase [Candidatus Nitrosacidococcus sp. I8]
MEVQLIEIAQFLGCEILGDKTAVISGVASLDKAQSGDLSFYTHHRYANQIKQSKATAFIISSKNKDQFINCTVIFSPNPYRDFARVINKWFNTFIFPDPNIHPTAIIGNNVEVAENCSIGAYCVIEDNVKIGTNTILFPFCYVGKNTTLGDLCILHPRVTLLERVIVGNRVIFHPGSVIGGDGFGFAPDPPQGYFKVPQIGWVEIADDVEIQCNTTIDRGMLGATRIGLGSKIDNLVQIAHNVEIGEHSVIVSQVGISGSSKVGNWVTLAGQVGLVGHIKIGDGAIVTAQSGVAKSIPPNMVVTGSPAQPIAKNRRALAEMNRISVLKKKIAELETRLNKLEKANK